MPITLPNLWLSFTATICFIITLFIYIKKPKAKANIFYSLTLLSCGLWTFFMVMFRIAEGRSAEIWALFIWISTIPILFFLVCSSFNFPSEIKFKNGHLAYLLISLPAIITLVVSVLYFGIFKEVKVISGYKGYVFNLPNFYFYCLYIVSYFFISFFVLYKQYNRAKREIEKIQVVFVILGSFISSLGGVIFGLALPLLGSFKFYWLSPGLLIVVLISFTYAIFKHHLFNVKVIATELFVVSISLILLIDTILAQNQSQAKFWFKIILFFGVVFFSVLLIRAVFKEVNSRKHLTRMTRRLKRANKELRELDETKSEFISIASHQLRTPLSIIKGFLSMISEGFYGKVSPSILDKIKKSLQSNERLIRLVDNLLDLSHIEKGKMDYQFKKLSLTGIVEDVFEELEQEAKEKNIKYILKRAEKNDLYVKADRQKIRQVIFNLIDNALKYTEKGKVEVRVKRTDGRVLFSVKDTGIGISKGDKKDLFEKFTRGKKVSRIWTEGAGLGLYIARLIVEEHKGRIGVKSEGENKGSEFWIKLPVVEEERRGGKSKN